MRRRGVVLLAVALVGLAVTSVAIALLTETPVLSSARNELDPAAAWNQNGSVEYLVFARSRANRPNTFDVFLRTTDTTPEPDTVTTVKLNRSGEGFGGGVDDRRAVYQQVGSGSDIKLFDLPTGPRSEPAGVNTGRWEWHPTISGDWVLFGRRKFSSPRRDEILLKNLATDELRTLASVRGISLYPGQVNGGFATWFRCGDVCNVFVHEIDEGTEGTTRRLPRPNTAVPRHQYASSIAPDGTAYIARSRNACGADVQIVRYPAGDLGTGTVVAELPDGRDILFAFVRSRPSTGNEVFYDRVSCSSDRWDVFKVTDP